MDIQTACVVVSLAMMAQHWFPWRKLPQLKGENLPGQLQSYSLGTVTILGVLTWLFQDNNAQNAVVSMWLVAQVSLKTFASLAGGPGYPAGCQFQGFVGAGVG